MDENKKKQSPFDAATLEHFRTLLQNKRKEAVNELNAIDQTVSNLNEADDADYSSVAHHQGDVGTDVEEEEMYYQLMERTQKYIQQLDDALERIDNNTYGICMATGKPISKERLEAVPHTRYTIEAKEKGMADDLK
ncbi:TraR/DksA family transcriptional regulator [Fodinibius sediminis]|uniref:Transcriptional regulator, TraR/DksA family n=1 Tax=Fodinibius sediminis TaxID=1214077 RepID=A0A521CVK1_9BACT|nr:TraR/DksA C4-type zinc finger protein [Fodinibius sediminis]SMO63484.1 transcriptional regulator, TraR/DksA family [Fodinibius sediminis]